MPRQYLTAVLLAITLANAQSSGTRFKVIFEWNYINFTWPSPEIYATAITTSTYIPENNHISGIKYFEDYLYITVPRMKEGIAATLTRIPYKVSDNYDTAPLLEPYPSWEMNIEGNCNALQNVQNVEIDPNGLLWILDGGKTATISKHPKNKCQPRLLIYDIKANRLITTYTFPQEMTNNGSFLYDLVIDDVDGGYAYITDNSGPDPAIIVYSMKQNHAWIIRDQKSMSAEPDALHFTVNGTGVSASINIAGIALGPRITKYEDHDIISQDRIVYYSALSSYTLYSINSAVLREEKSATSGISSHIKNLGKRASQTDGMVMDENGVLYYGLLADNSIAKWDSKTPFTSTQKVIAKDKTYIQWPDAFTFDMFGNLLVTTNKLQKYIYGRINLTEPNYRILQGYVGAKSYLYANSMPTAENTEKPATDITTMSDRGRNQAENNDHLYYETHTLLNNSEVERHMTGTPNASSSAVQVQFNIFCIILTLTLLVCNKK